MNILHVIRNFPRRNGTTIRMREILKYDTQNEHTFLSLVDKHRITDDEMNFADNISFYRVEIKQNLFWRMPFLRFIHANFYFPLSKLSLIKKVVSREFDLVQAHNPFRNILLGYLLARMKRIPLIIDYHGVFYGGANKGLRTRLGEFILQCIEKRIVARAQRLLFQTEESSTIFKQLFHVTDGKIIVIPNGISDMFFQHNNIEGQAIREHLQIERGRKVLIYFGYLDERINGIPFLLRGLRTLRAQLPNFVLLVLGEGPCKQEVETFERRYPENMRYLGSVEREKVPAYLDIADVVVLTRPRGVVTETTIPLKVLESIAMNKVIFISKIKAFEKLLDEYHRAFFYTPENEESFVQNLLWVMEHSGEVNEIPANSGAIIKEFSWEKAFRKLSSIYERL